MFQAGLSPEELAAEAVVELPDRELLQPLNATVTLDFGDDVAVALNWDSDDAEADADASKDIDIEIDQEYDEETTTETTTTEE